VRTPTAQPGQGDQIDFSGAKSEITVNGVKPLVVNKRVLVVVFGGATKLVEQLLSVSSREPSSNWLDIVRPGSPGVEVLVDRASVERAYARIKNGELPPLLPSQIRAKSVEQRPATHLAKRSAVRRKEAEVKSIDIHQT
jgi:hypothetical protein